MASRKYRETGHDDADTATGYATAVRLVPVKRASVQDKAQDRAASRKAAQDVEPDAPHYRLRLFVTGTTPRSARAIQNIRTICEAHLAGRYDLQVIDIYQHPEHVKAEQIVVTPTLVKQSPLPLRKLIGDLSDTERVLAALDIVPLPLPKDKNAA